jgi:hypothetical protein
LLNVLHQGLQVGVLRVVELGLEVVVALRVVWPELANALVANFIKHLEVWHREINIDA